jgi:hypothetical protein
MKGELKGEGRLENIGANRMITINWIFQMRGLDSSSLEKASVPRLVCCQEVTSVSQNFVKNCILILYSYKNAVSYAS